MRQLKVCNLPGQPGGVEELGECLISAARSGPLFFFFFSSLPSSPPDPAKK